MKSQRSWWLDCRELVKAKLKHSSCLNICINSVLYQIHSCFNYKQCISSTMYNIQIISQLPLLFDYHIWSIRYKVNMMIQTFGIFKKFGETIKIVLKSRCDIRIYTRIWFSVLSFLHISNFKKARKATWAWVFSRLPIEVNQAGASLLRDTFLIIPFYTYAPRRQLICVLNSANYSKQ